MARRERAAVLRVEEPDLFSYQPAVPRSVASPPQAVRLVGPSEAAVPTATIQPATIQPATIQPATTQPALIQPAMTPDPAAAPPRPRSPLDAEPLTVSLADEAFAWVLDGEKIWELRRRGRQFNESTVTAGRAVAFSRGFRSDRAIMGEIVEVIEAASVRGFLESVPYQAVIPVAETCDEAVAVAARLLGPGGSGAVIGFRIEIARHDAAGAGGSDPDSQVRPAKAAQPARVRRKPAK